MDLEYGSVLFVVCPGFADCFQIEFNLFDIFYKLGYIFSFVRNTKDKLLNSIIQNAKVQAWLGLRKFYLKILNVQFDIG